MQRLVHIWLDFVWSVVLGPPSRLCVTCHHLGTTSFVRKTTRTYTVLRETKWFNLYRDSVSCCARCATHATSRLTSVHMKCCRPLCCALRRSIRSLSKVSGHPGGSTISQHMRVIWNSENETNVTIEMVDFKVGKRWNWNSREEVLRPIPDLQNILLSVAFSIKSFTENIIILIFPCLTKEDWFPFTLALEKHI